MATFHAAGCAGMHAGLSVQASKIGSESRLGFMGTGFTLQSSFPATLQKATPDEPYPGYSSQNLSGTIGVQNPQICRKTCSGKKPQATS